MAETDPQLAAIAKAILPLGPGAAGALLSLALAEQLTVRGKLLSALGGLAAAAFVAPAVTLMLNPFIPGESVPLAVANLVGFLSGTFGMIVLTGLAKALALYSSDPLKLVKVDLGAVKIGGGQ
jgi:hypothetical protein